MTTPRPKGWRIGLTLTPQATPPGWAVGLRFAEQSIPDADQLTPGGTLPAAFTEGVPTMTNRALRGMSSALFDSDLIASRLALFLAEALWAIMLFWPGDTFDRPTYSEMAEVAPELAGLLPQGGADAVLAQLQTGAV